MYIYVYIFMYIYIYIYMFCLYIYIYIYIHERTHTHMYGIMLPSLYLVNNFPTVFLSDFVWKSFFFVLFATFSNLNSGYNT